MAGIRLVEITVLEPATAESPGHDFTVYDAYLASGAGELGLLYHEISSGNVTQAKPLKPVRSDVGNDPWETRPESGDAWSQGDFSHGSGQEYFHEQNRDVKKFLWSEGFDLLSNPGRISHLQATTKAKTITGTGKMAVAGGLLFIADPTHVQRGDGTLPGTYTSEDPYAGETADTAVYDLVGSGDELYAALGGRGVHKRDSGGTWTHFNDVAATCLAWVKDRLMAADGRNIYEISPASTTSTPASIVTLPAGWTFTSIFESGAFIYACASNTNSGHSKVYAFNEQNGIIVVLTSTDMPRDQIIKTGVGYLNLIYLGGGTATTSGGYDPVVYQAFGDGSGGLNYVKLADATGAGASDLGVRCIKPLGETVALGWSLGAGATFGERTGLALHDLGRDAFVNYLKREGAGHVVVDDIRRYKGRLVFVVDGDGLYYENPSLFVPTATMIPSVADWDNAGLKIWDRVELFTKPLPVGGAKVQVDYTKKLPEDDDWVAALTYNVPGTTGQQTKLVNIKSRMFGLKFTSTSSTDQTLAPEILSFAVRSNPAPAIPEYTLTRTIQIFDQDRKDADGEVVYNDVHGVRRQIMDLIYTWATLYEAGLTWDVRITSVSVVPSTLLVGYAHTPMQPMEISTGGDTGRDGVLLQIDMDATRSA